MMETAQSFTARRSAASNLPTFQLPPPDHISSLHKYPAAYAPTSASQPTPAVPNSVLTPPAAAGDGLSPMASSVNSGSSVSSAAGPPYQQMGYWPTPGNSYTYSSAPPMSTPYAQQNYMARPQYAPPTNFQNRNTNSPSTGEGLPPPPYDVNLPFPTSMPMSGSGPQPNQPNMAPQQSQQQQQMTQGMMNPQQQQSQAPHQGPPHAPDNYGGRPPPTPTYYTPSSTPQQSSFPAYAQQSPTNHSPNPGSGPANRNPGPPGQGPMNVPPVYPQQRPPYPGYNLPAMSGQVLSNVHNPGAQMVPVGGMSMQYQPHHMGAPMYGPHPGQQPPQNDRPFKCDQCPQSFNRNHDLKRHKRIHLAVKPFPCGHCEKSFSRKDALKRHILVKGCGKSPTAGGSTQNQGSQSPLDKSDMVSDGSHDRGQDMKKE
ncbi:hypothetical protein F5884DRAFT_277315 [Xylogone sp. PMI_703]|nr:hypothetical protein F5884DRAFT_277315 [Xylogone sp. PMI_703]